MVHTPVSSEADDDSDDYELHIDDQDYAQEEDILNKFKLYFLMILVLSDVVNPHCPTPH